VKAQPQPTTDDHSVLPPACLTCGSARTWEIDPSETDAEWFMWCEACAHGEFPSEAEAPTGPAEDGR
jgi:hypothetical protein